jgi:hypothetical protein
MEVAVGAVQQDGPVVRPGLLPLDRIDEVRAATEADVKVLIGLGRGMLRSGQIGLGGTQQHHLDGLATGQDHALNRLRLFVSAFHLHHPQSPYRHRSGELERH